jgi:HD-GYP domain-containing protein (c-di-GMP phosphodiesterase class II)
LDLSRIVYNYLVTDYLELQKNQIRSFGHFKYWLIWHPTFAAVIMEPSPQLRSIIPQIKAHHERYDGSGYPAGLVGEEIPFFARIIPVADAFVTMTEGRVYQTPRSVGEALAELIHCRGLQFDPNVVDTLSQLIKVSEVDDSHCQWEACD